MYIEIKKLSKVYRKGQEEIRAVNSVNLKIERGDFVVLWGVSGSGKTTLLNLMGGLDNPTFGEVVVDGLNISTMDFDSLALYRKEKLGFILQYFHTISTLTVLENVLLPLATFNLPFYEKRKRCTQVIRQVELEKRINHLPSELSGGEKQRVAIARALINNPQLILADEPTSDLDTRTSQNIINILEELNKQGRTIIIATHDHRIAERAKHQLIMEDGRIIEEVRR